MTTTYTPKKLTSQELTELHALPDDSLLTAQEAAAFLRLKYGTLAWYRCQGGGPAFVRIGPKLIRYRMGDLRDYAKGQPMGEGVQRAAMAMRAARTAKAEG
ncbi:helix-turn-helix domain-containing protein [Pseudomonas sp.]|uniref:helix-turn-helix transcriptional regulator n=1 Tax=Pseudomonas sp. TaxID=306 RepID=UPI00299F48B7|nr:helix-turn-helix domain-containing protein [Pseudomonas sp.]MDX1370144.1 helix-turn-helix domain-containing protein [Pseudomonas sp.]